MKLHRLPARLRWHRQEDASSTTGGHPKALYIHGNRRLDLVVLVEWPPSRVPPPVLPANGPFALTARRRTEDEIRCRRKSLSAIGFRVTAQREAYNDRCFNISLRNPSHQPITHIPPPHSPSTHP